jgi:hypothetical protein
VLHDALHGTAHRRRAVNVTLRRVYEGGEELATHGARIRWRVTASADGVARR